MFRITLGVIALVALLATGVRAQEDVEAKLARALVLEETGGDPGKAAEVYQAVLADTAISADARLRASLGIARCHRRAGETEPARAILDGLAAKLAKDSPMRAQIEAERARLEGVAKPNDEELRKKVEQLAAQGEVNEIVRMGRAVVGTLVAILEEPAPRGVTSIDHQVAQALLKMPGDDIPALARRIVVEAKSAKRSLLVECLRYVIESQPGRWDAVLQAAVRDPLENVREQVIAFVPKMGAGHEEVWEILLQDEVVDLRRRAHRSYLGQWTKSSDERFFAVYRRALQDPAVEVRQDLPNWLRQAKTRDFDRMLVVLEALLKDPDPDTRRNTLNSLYGVLPRSRAKPYFLAAIEDPVPQIREIAVGALRGRIDVGDVAVIRPLLVDIRQGTRSNAASALSPQPAAAICDDAVAEALLLECLDDRDSRARGFAASVLARVGSKKVAEAMRGLFRDQNSSIRHTAVYYMIRQDLIEALPVALEVISEIGNYGNWGNSMGYCPNNFRAHPSVGRSSPQAAILEWLKRRNHRGSLPLLLSHAADFETTLDDEMASVCEALTGDDREDVFRRVVAIENIEWRNRLLNELGRFFGAAPYALAYYSEGLSNLAVEVREASARALHEHGSAAAVPAMIGAIEDEKTERVAEWLSSAVARHADASHVPAIGQALERASDRAVQNTLVRTLGGLGTDEALDILVSRLDEVTAPRAAIMSYMGKHRVERAGEIIRKKLAGDEFKRSAERIAAVRALGKMGQASDVPVLLETMKKYRDREYDRHYRYSLAGLVANIAKNGSRRYFPAALLALYDMGPQVYLEQVPLILEDEGFGERREMAVRLLAFIDDSRSDDLIVSALGHGDPKVRRSAADVAGHALLVEGRGKLRRLLRDSDVGVRNAANRALRRLVEFGVN